MKTIRVAVILLIIATFNLNAKTTDMYQHARAVRLGLVHQKNVKNYSKKLFFATKAAKAGNPKAQFDLAIMYAGGQGVKKDERLAFYWFHKSARAGYAPAKYYMGLSFEQGRGVKANPYLARYWFKQALKAGNRKAIYHISQIEAFLNNKSRNHYSMR